MTLGGGFALMAVDRALATSSHGTVSGHRWQRTIEIMEADPERRPPGVLPLRKPAPSAQHKPMGWKRVGVAEATGSDLQPTWPVAQDDACQDAGCRRPGARRDRYEVVVVAHDGSELTCEVDEADWHGYTLGSPVDLSTGGLSGVVRCDRP